MTEKPTLAIIGTGIAGMSAGYFLKDRYDITFYEKNDYAGGHTNTITVQEKERPVFVDSGFMVYNEVTYPNLCRLFDRLKVKTKSTDMSFSVQHIPSNLEYNGAGINAIFAQRLNVLNPSFIKMLMDMHRFCKEADEVLEDPVFSNETLMSYTKKKGYGDDFRNKFLIPMSSAVWSTPPDLMLDFPAETLIRFFKNHGFMGLKTHYQWRTVEGGSRQYRDKIISQFPQSVHLKRGVKSLRRNGRGVTVIDQYNEKQDFDLAIAACHADEALKLIDQPTFEEETLLSPFKYQTNRTILHTDSSVMPKAPLAWAAWNYRIQTDDENRTTTTTIYNMNRLQGVSEDEDYFISLNDPGLVDPESILWEDYYTHPIFCLDAIKAQKSLARLNGEGPIYFCGSYFRYGFHEDALASSIHVVEQLTGEPVWN